MAGDFLDFGIEDTSIVSDSKVFDDLFSPVTGDAEGVLPITEKKEEVKKEEQKKPDVPKPNVKEIEDSMFGGEEKEKEKTEKEEKEDESEEEEGEEGNQFETFSKELYKIGIFTPDVDEDGNEVSVIARTGEELKSLFETQSDKKLDTRLNNFLMNKHGEEGLRTFEAIFVNGVDPREYFDTYTEIQDLSELKPEDEEHQEIILREFYKDLAPEKVTKLIQRLKDVSELQNQAEDLLPQLIEKNKKALEEKEAQAVAKTAKLQKLDGDYRNSITKILQDKTKEKEFNGLPVNEKLAQEAYDFLYNKKWVYNGEKLTDFDVWVMESKKPENAHERVLVALLKKSGFDFSKIQKKAQSTSATKYFQSFAEKKTSAKKKQGVEDEKESTWPL